MNKQTTLKIIHLTHQRDELIQSLQDLAETLSPEDVNRISQDIVKINKTLKKLQDA